MSDLLRKLREDPAGRRFRNAYDAARHWSLLRRFAAMWIGVLSITVGIVMLVTPGPGLVAIAVGLAMLGLSAHPLAKLLDRCEMAGRRRIEVMGPKARRAAGWAIMLCAGAAALATWLISRSLI